MKKQIPNLLTLGNLVCGVMAAYQASLGYLHRAAILMLCGILFDFLDGFAARMLKVQSPMGKELDSLADVVTSGVVPGIILYNIFRIFHPCGLGNPFYWLRFVGFLIPAFAAYRLAKFNIDDRQGHSFLGLPAPSNALIWAAIGTCFIHGYDWAQVALLPIPNLFPILRSTAGLIVLAVLSLATDVLMVSEVPMMGLKFTSFGWKENSLKYILLIGAAVLIVFFGIIGIAFAIVWYILLSLFTRRCNA